MATIANLVLRISGDNAEAKRSLAAISADLKAFNAAGAEAAITLAGPAAASAQIRRLEEQLDILGRKRVSPEVKVDIDRSRAQLAILRRELDGALRGRTGSRATADILRDIEKLGVKTAQVAGDFTSLGARMASFGTTAGEAGVKLGDSLLSGLISVLTTLPLLVIGFIALSAVIGAFIAVVGALASVLAFAAAGLGVILLGAFAALLPVLLVVGLAIKKVMDAFQALGKQQENAKKQAEALRQAQQTLADSADRVAESQKNVSEQYVAAKRAERDAADEARSAELALQSAKLGEAEASLRLDRAKAALKGLKDEAKGAAPALQDLFKRFTDVDFKPSDAKKLLPTLTRTEAKSDADLDVKGALLEVARAQLGVKEAAQGTKDATDNLSDATAKNNEFIRKGVMAYDPYVSALKQAEAASRSYTEAQRGLAKVEEEGELRDAKGKKISPEALEAAKAVKSFVAEAKRSLGPALNEVFGGVGDLMEGLADLMKDKGVRNGFRDIGRAVGAVLTNIGRLARSRGAKDLFSDLLSIGGRLFRILGGRIFPEFVALMLRLARAAGPGVIRLFRDFGRFLTRLGGGAKDSKRLEGGVDDVIGAFRSLMRFVRAVARLVINFFKAGEETGEGLLDKITKIFNKWADFLDTEEGQQAVKDFLEDGIEFAGQLWEIFKAVVSTMDDAIPIAKAFLDVAKEAFNVAKKAADALALTETPVQREVRERTKTVADLEKQLESGKGENGKRLTYPQQRELQNRLALETDLLASAEGDVEDSRGRKLQLPGSVKKFIKKAQDGKVGRAWGGMIPGTGGFGDEVPLVGEGGEYMIRRSVVAQVGVPYLDALNSGNLSQHRPTKSGGNGGMHVENLNLPPAPAAAVPDARHQAAQLQQLMNRKGG